MTACLFLNRARPLQTILSSSVKRFKPPFENTYIHIGVLSPAQSQCYSTEIHCKIFAFPLIHLKKGNVIPYDKRSYSTQESKKSGKELDVSRENPYAGLSTAEKVREAGKDASYIAIIVAGIGVMGLMFFTVGKELFSSQSPAGVYGKALKLCQKNDDVIDILGEPITGHGTSGSRRRKQHVSSQEFMVNGVKHMKVMFNINGPHRKAAVHVEVYQDENKKYQYKYLIVDLDGYPKKTIVIENNR